MLTTEKITYTYEEGQCALEEVTVELERGKVIGIIGENGSGKSTLFMTLMGLICPNSGRVCYNGQPLKYDKKSLIALRKKVGIVFQDPDKQIFYPNVKDDIAFALRNIGLSEEEVNERVQDALEKVGAIYLQDRPVHALSYGEKKRVAIASVLAMRNPIILLDEPTAGLDPASVEKMVELIKQLVELGHKIVLSSHDMDFIYELCDYLYVLKKGKIHIEGKWDEVFSQEEALKEAGLRLPWLVKVHKRMGMPLCKTEEELFSMSGCNGFAEKSTTSEPKSSHFQSLSAGTCLTS